MKLREVLFGRPLASWEDQEHRVTTIEGVPLLGLDALASAAYGPEAALAVLAVLGAGAAAYIQPITAAIIAILAILYFSYRQTIYAYSNGGGAYTVASENLGKKAGLLAAAALLLDYVLSVAVGISAGVGALISAAPALQGYMLLLCLCILVLVAVVNLRGVRDSGLIFSLPTYVFVATLLLVMALGVWSVFSSGGHPKPVVAPAHLGAEIKGVSIWLVLRAFASGCTAMTGVEAVSNGVQAFRDPGVKYAQRTLTIIVIILGVLLAGIAFLAHAYGIGAMNQEHRGYQSVISQIVAAVSGRGWIYYVTIASVLTVLCLSANTGFSDFPRLCRLLAEDGYLPSGFADRGTRLVFSRGIVTLTFLAGLLLAMFGGVTDRLIPLFAIGAFGAFTLSQAGMVRHWHRSQERGRKVSMVINGIGALATGAALLIVFATKFSEGAWVTAILIGGAILFFSRVRDHYDTVARETKHDAPINTDEVKRPRVFVPIKDWDLVSEKALRFAQLLSPHVEAVFVAKGNEEEKRMRERWAEFVEEPLSRSGREAPVLKVLTSPYRRITSMFLEYLIEQSSQGEGMLVVVIPELVEARWYQYLLHNQRAVILKAKLYFRGNRRIVVVNVPWYLRAQES